MNALQTLKRNRDKRRAARNRAAFWRTAGAWVGVVALAVVSIPAVAAVAWLIGTGINL